MSTIDDPAAPFRVDGSGRDRGFLDWKQAGCYQPAVNPRRLLKDLTASIEGFRPSPWYVIIVPAVVGSIRALFEGMMFRLSSSDELLNTVLFYTLLILVFSIVLSIATRTPPARQLPAAALGAVLGIVPPFLDYGLRLVGFEQPGSGYMFAREFHWHFVADYELVGESVVVWSGIVAAGTYCGVSKRSVLRGLVAAALSWVALQAIAFGWPMLTRLLFDLQQGDRLLPAMNWIGLAALLPLYWWIFVRDPKAVGGAVIEASVYAALVVLSARLVGEEWPAAFAKAGVFAAVASLSFSVDGFARRKDAPDGRDVLFSPVVAVAFYVQVLFALQVFRFDTLACLPIVLLAVSRLVHSASPNSQSGIARDPVILAAWGAPLSIFHGIKLARGFGGRGDEIWLGLLAALICGAGFLVAGLVGRPAESGNVIQARLQRSRAHRAGRSLIVALLVLLLLASAAAVWATGGHGFGPFLGGAMALVLLVALADIRPRPGFYYSVLLILGLSLAVLAHSVEPLGGSGGSRTAQTKN